MSVALAIIPVRRPVGLSLLVLGERAAELKSVAKGRGPGSAWARDERGGGNAAPAPADIRRSA